MKKRICISSLLLVLLAAFWLVGCTNEPDVPPTPETEPEIIEPTEPEVPETEDYDEDDVMPEGPTSAFDIHGALHRIEYGDNVVYLFGTLHGSHPEWFPLADIVEDAMARADVFALEIDISDMDMLVAVMEEMVLLPDGLTWAEFLPQEAYDHLVEVIASYDIPYEEVNTMNPVFLIHTIYMEFITLLSDLDLSNMGVDGYVLEVATTLGRPVIGLEAAEQQLNILYNPPFDVVLYQIMHFLPPIEMLAEIMGSDDVSVDDLAFMYEANDIAALIDVFTIELSIAATIDSPYGIYTRDIVMNYRSTYYANAIARLLRETDEPTTFFAAVGISHVIRASGGEEFTDIVEQLGLLGFDVVPLWQ
ncbi:MAG: TraB/GumN family protein [Oscillospiraceae bacterium]|nr:TraB/GumN family protein [Oscillospiraceae bacterium]